MAPKTSGFEEFAYQTAPPLDPAWLAFDRDVASKEPKKEYASQLERQPEYARERREFLQKMTAPGAPFHDLSQGIERKDFTIPSSVDGFAIPIMQFDLTQFKDQDPEIVIIYYHGGGLVVGEADSEELSCRQLIKSGLGRLRLYSVGYRLKPSYPASTILSDAFDGFREFHAKAPRTVVVGSSSGGQLASAVSQMAPTGSIQGVLLRGPVTGDANSGMEYIPERLRPYHTSVSSSFLTSFCGYLTREIPRDGLPKLPIEAGKDELQGLPRNWIQVASNDVHYSDGLCYAIALKDAGVEVQLDIVQGWPHTFWLNAPDLPRAMEADQAMLEGLKWVLS